MDSKAFYQGLYPNIVFSIPLFHVLLFDLARSDRRKKPKEKQILPGSLTEIY
jgi:hypothetical protein